MAVVGDASVIVRAITDKVKGDIERAFRDARPAVQAAGRDHAKAYSDSFTSQLKNNMSKSMGDVYKDPGVNAAASRGGRDHARAYSGTFENELGKLDMAGALKNSMAGAEREMGDEAEKAADAAGQRAEAAARRSFGNAGRGGGNAFSRMLSSGFADAAMDASRGFTMMYAAGNLLGPAIANLVGAVSSLVSGFFAMGSAASVAAGALGVLPGMAAAAVQGMGTLKLAFSGIGSALSAGLKASNQQIGATSNQAVSSANAVASAQRSLARARQDGADAAADSARRVADAERDVNDAEKEVLVTTKALAAARKAGREELQQLAFSAEDAALGEQRAQLNLEDAYKKMLALQNLPADDSNRRDAELSYKEAELAYRQAKDRNADLQAEQKKAAKTGVEGTKAVTDARKDANSAQKGLADKERALADARRAQQRQQRDSAQAIADAERALADAQKANTRAMAKGTTATNAYNTALNQLSPSARAFVKHLIGMKDQWKGLKEAAGAELFPKLTTSLDQLSRTLLPTVRRELKETGGLLGDAAQGFTDAVTKGRGLERTRKIIQGNNDIIRIFTRRGRDGTNTFGHLANILTKVLVAVQPLTNRFGRWVAKMIEGVDAATRVGNKTSGLTGFFKKAGDRAALLGRIFGNIWGILRNLGKAADSSGVGLFKSFEKATQKLQEFTGKPAQQKELKKFFDGVADNMRKIGDLIVVVGQEFFKLGDNKGIGDLATNLIPAVRNLGDMGDKFTENGSSLGKFVTSVTELFNKLSDTGTIDTFLGILTDVVDKVNEFIDSDFGSWLVNSMSRFSAVSRALGIIAIVAGFAFKVLIGGPLRVLKNFRKLGTFLGGFKRVMTNLRTGKSPFEGLGKSSDEAKKKFEEQMVVDEEKMATLKLLEEQADKTARALERAGVGGGAANAQKGADKIDRQAAGAVGPAAAGVGDKVDERKIGKLGGAAEKAGGGFRKMGASLKALPMMMLGLSWPVLLVVAAIGALVFMFVKLYKHSPQFKKFIDNIVSKVKELGKWIGEIFTKYVFPALDKFFGWVNKYLPVAGEKIAWVFGNVIVPYLRILWRVWSTVFKAIWAVVKVVFDLIKWYVLNIVVPIFKNVLWPLLRTLWNVAKWVFNQIKDKWTWLWDRIKWIYNNVVRPVVGTIKSKISELWANARDIIDKIKNKWDWFHDKFVAIKDKIVAIATSIKTSFTNIGDGIASAFSGIWGKVKGPLKTLIGFINDNFIDGLNVITKPFGLKIPSIPNEFAEGGYTGPGPKRKVAGLVHADEHVIKAVSRRKLEQQFPGALDYMNRTGMIPRAAIPMGDWGPFGGVISGAKSAGSGVWHSMENLAKSGVGTVLEKVVHGFSDMVEKLPGVKRGGGKFIDDFLFGVLDKLAVKAKAWGDDKNDEAKKKAQPALASMPLGSAIYVAPPGSPAHISTYQGKYFTNLFIAHLKMAERIAGTAMHIIQGGFRPATSYSGTSHRGDAIDISVNYRLLGALRRVGIAAGDRTGLGSWAPHIHAIPGPGAGFAAGSALWQWQDYLAKGGARQGPRSPWGLAAGAFVPRQPGGILANIGEGARNERVEPLDPSGLSRRDQAMIDLIKSSVEGKSGDHFHVHPSPGMDENKLAHMVSRRVAWRKAVGT